MQIQTAGTNQTDFTLTAAYSDPNNSSPTAITGAAWSRGSLGAPTTGSNTLTTTIDSPTVSFLTTQTFATGDNIRLDSDGGWYQIMSGGTGTSFTLTSNFTGTAGTGAWSKIAASPVYVNISDPASLDNTSVTPTAHGVRVEMRLVDTTSVGTSLNFATGLPALPVSVTANGSIQLAAGFAFELALTYDANKPALSSVNLDDTANLGDAFNNSPATNVTPLTAGSGTLTLMNGSTTATFSMPETFAAGDSIRLANDPNGAWYQIQTGGTNTTFTLTAPYTGTTPAGAWATLAANPVNIPATDLTHQLAVFIDATLPSSPTPFSATATIGFLQGTITDIGNPTSPGYVKTDPTTHTEFTGSFLLDGLGTLVSGTGSPTVELIANADANLHIDGGFVNGANFPSIVADFHLAWQFDSKSSSGLTAPTVGFTNVGMDMGTFLSDFLKPIITKVQDVTDYLKPLESILGTAVPGLSDLSKLIGNGPITIMDLTKVAAEYSGYGPLFDIIKEVLNVVNLINGLTVSGGDVTLNFGGFDLDQMSGSDWENAAAAGDPGDLSVPDLSDLEPNPADLGSLVTSFSMALAKIAPNLPPALNTAIGQLTAGLNQLNNGIDIEFPILDNPASAVFGMLLGKDSDLATFTANFTATAYGSLATGLSFAGIGVNFTSAVTIDFSFKFAYDTYGLREVFHDIEDKNPNPDFVSDILDGFYVDDSSHLSVSGDIGVSVGAYFGVASLAIGGYLSTGNGGNDPITASLNDPQIGPANAPDSGTDGGKFRISKLLTDGEDPFNLTGELDAALEIQARFGVTVLGTFVGFEKDFDIASVTLVDFNTPPTPPPIVLASQPDANGQVTLYVGADANLRQNTDATDGGPGGTGENYTIADAGGTPAPGRENITVTFNNVSPPVSQTIDNVSTIVGRGDAGALNIHVDSGVSANVDLHGGALQDTLIYDGSGTARLYAGTLGGILVGGTGTNYLYGSGAGGTPANPVNYLIGGSGASLGQVVTNYLYAGAAAAALGGGQQYSTNYFYAGPYVATVRGTTSATANGGTNIYAWNEGDNPFTIYGSNPNGLPNANQLDVIGGFSGGETWYVEPLAPGNALNGTVPGSGLVEGIGNQNNPLPQITFSGVSGLNLDTPLQQGATPNTYLANPGGNSFIIGDLSATGIQALTVNYHEYKVPDTIPDTITINGINADDGPTPYADQVTFNDVTASSTPGADYENALVESVQLTVLAMNDVGVHALSATTYTVDAAIPQSGDDLTLNTFAGDDEVQVNSTAGAGSTFINTGAGSGAGGENQITVGDPNLPLGLDGIQGPLSIDAGNGQNNALTFTEAAADTGDTATLTADALIRYSTSTVPVNYNPFDESGTPTEIRYAFQISYTATGGAFTPGSADFGHIVLNGIQLDTTTGTDNDYVASALADTQVTVNTGPADIATGDPQDFDNVFIGYDGGAATSSYDPEPSSTLAGILSPVTIVGGGANGKPGTNLTIDDSGAGANEVYTLLANELDRAHAAPIDFNTLSAPNTQLVALTLKAGAENNTIDVESTDAATAPLVAGAPIGGTTVDTGPGNNRILVSDAGLLNGIDGPLVVNGGAGTDTLTLDDAMDSTGQSYVLGVTTNPAGQVTGGTVSLSHFADNAGNVIYVFPINIAYSSISRLGINAGAGGTAFMVQSTPATTTAYLSALGSTNSITGPVGTVDWQFTQTGDGFAAGTGPAGVVFGAVNFSNIQAIQGGSGNDDFQFLLGGGFDGSIDGGAGTDTLDFSWDRSASFTGAGVEITQDGKRGRRAGHRNRSCRRQIPASITSTRSSAAPGST